MICKVINECQTRLDTDNLDLWREAGLPIDKDGYILISGIDLDSGPLPSERARKSPGLRLSTSSKVSGAKSSVKEDIISNALIWLSCKTSPTHFFLVRADWEHRDNVSVLPCSPEKDNADLEKYNSPTY